jgi:hypothetical protein
MNFHYRIMDDRGYEWPEMFVSGQEESLASEVGWLREQYPHRVFRVQRRCVGDWESCEVSEMQT